MMNVNFFCELWRQGTTSVVPNSVDFSLKGHGFSRAVPAPRIFPAGFSPRALSVGGVA